MREGRTKNFHSCMLWEESGVGVMSLWELPMQSVNVSILPALGSSSVASSAARDW